MSGFTQDQIIEKIRETADRVFAGIGIKKKWYSEIEQKPTDLSHRRGEVSMVSSNSMIWSDHGCWCEYRVEMRYEHYVDVRITVRGIRGDKLTVDVDNSRLDETTDFDAFCRELKQRFEKRAKPVTNE